MLKEIPTPNALNTSKSVLQLLLGVLILHMSGGAPDIVTIVLGTISFGLAYSAVYFYNDLMDYEEDSADPSKGWKPLVTGELSREAATSALLAFLVLGFSTAILLPVEFQATIALLLGLNFLYSSHVTRLKSNIYSGSILIFVMQVAKFSLGWTIGTWGLTGLPWTLITSLAGLYTFACTLYKNSVTRGRVAQAFSYSILAASVAGFGHSFIVYGLENLFLLLAAYVLVMGGVYISKYEEMEHNDFVKISVILFSVALVIGFYLPV